MTLSDEKNERFRYLYDRYYRSVVSFLVHFGLTRDEARDLAQDVFVRVYEHMADYRGEAEWKFLEVTARRLAINRARGQLTLKRRGRSVGIETLLETAGNASSLDDDLAERELQELRRKKLERAIAQLPDGPRTCLLLWLQECTYTGIQAILGISMDAVKSRLHDAKIRLRALLAEEPEGISWPENAHDPQE